MSEKRDILVIGAGPAGLSAGLYGARMGLRTAIIGEIPGGMASEAWLVENYPGFDSIKGPDLVEKMRTQAVAAGVEMFIPSRVESLSLNQGKVTARSDSIEVESEALILATGCCHRMLGAPGEEEHKGKGVSYCAVCDGVFFRGKKVAVVGGGNTAAMEALYLSEIAEKVFMIHRRDDLRADAKLKEQISGSGVQVIWNKTVKRIGGETLVDEIVLRDTQSGDESSLGVDGVFIAIGESPQSQLARDIGAEIDETGFIAVGRKQETNVPGVYAAGDVTGGVHQIGVAVGQGISAAVNAYLYVTGGWYGRKKGSR